MNKHSKKVLILCLNRNKQKKVKNNKKDKIKY